MRGVSSRVLRRSYKRTRTLHANRLYNVLICSTVWPEVSEFTRCLTATKPGASAAGVRTVSIIEALVHRANCKVTVTCAAREKVPLPVLKKWGVKHEKVELNDETGFKSLLESTKPNVVIYDRFVAEEMYGWMVRENFPEALNVIDTQDLHSLRDWRKTLANQGTPVSTIAASFPDSSSTQFLRELASIHRSDLSLVCSTHELNLLEKVYGVNKEKIKLASFFYEKSNVLKTVFTELPFITRKNFLMLGNFRHLPNTDAIEWASKFWDKIRKQQPHVELHVHGAYMPNLKGHKPEKGIHMLGEIPENSLFQTMKGFRVNLAPLRFGAGIKGKITDGFFVGLPVVTTSIGAEGLLPISENVKEKFGGIIADTEQELVDACVELYRNEKLWKEKMELGQKLVGEYFDKEKNGSKLVEDITEAMKKPNDRDYVSAMLLLTENNYHKYFSKYLNIKQGIQAQNQPPKKPKSAYQPKQAPSVFANDDLFGNK